MKPKTKRNDGWKTPTSTLNQRRQDIIDECLEPTPYYDSWVEQRDGYRSPVDRTKIYKKTYIDIEDDFRNNCWSEKPIIKDWNKRNKGKLVRRRYMKQIRPRS